MVDAAGKLIRKVDLDLPMPVMMHDMLITEEHAVFLDSPIVFDMNAMATGESMIQWKPDNGTRVGVMPRMGDADSIRWFDVPTSHVQHFWNAFAEGSRIELSGCRFEEVNFGIEAEGSDKESGVTTIGAKPARYWVDLDTGESGSEFFDDMDGEFCRINDDYTGVRADCLYMSGFTRPNAAAGDFDTIVKYDMSTGTRTQWYSGEHGHIGENVFAPDPNGEAEDDGWLINSTHDDATNTSEVVVLDAREIEAGPIARVQIPQRMPFGFHANWFAAD